MSAVIERSLGQSPVTDLKNVGAKMAEKLAKLSIHSVQDLLFHLPLRYLDRTRVTPIGTLQSNVHCVIEGEVTLSDVIVGRRRSLAVRIQDGTGTITLRFYHFNAAQKNILKIGARIRCFGEARRGSNGLELYHPEYQVVDASKPFKKEETLTPIYPSTDGLTQVRWRQDRKSVV